MKGIKEIDNIIRAVSIRTKVSMSDILSQSRESRIIKAKHLSMWICRFYTKASLQTIATVHSCKRHATVINASKQIDNLCFTNKTFKLELREFCKQFSNQ